MTLTITNSWPATLPLPQIEFSGSPVNSVITSTGGIPPVDRRSRWTRSYGNAFVSWVLTESEYTAFETFFIVTLGMGTALFDIELRYPLNSALTHWAVRFQDAFEAERDDNVWRVQAALDIVNPITF